MRRITKRALTAAVVAAATLPAFAVPARPGVFNVTQPDGTVIPVTLNGDEFMHYYMDKDGYIIEPQDDGWYRILDNNGVATSLVPMDFNMRSEAEQVQIMNINPQMTFNSLQARSLTTGFVNVNRAPAMYRAGTVPPGKWDNADGHDIRAIPTDGERHVLVILVSFADLKWRFSDDPQAEMTAMLNEPGYTGNHCTGSAGDFFRQSSNGLYQPKFDVYGPVQLSKPYSYYGRNVQGTDSAPWEMVSEACTLLDDEVDFSIYDTDKDGYVDNVYVFYAGHGENEGAGTNYVWPHAYNLHYKMNPPVLDDVKIDHYACSNELTLRFIENDPLTHSGIGTFCHEFSHVLGLPDLYSTNYTGAHSPGAYSTMDQGSYNNNSRTPPLYSIYEKYALEWEKPIDITESADINMQPTVDGGYAYRITIDPSRPTEYYLFENRQPHSWDTYIPGKGMLVWHIDFDKSVWNNNIVNDNGAHQHIDIVESDGTADSSSWAGDTFPGISNRSDFTATAQTPYPKFVNWDGKASPLDITNIGEDVTGTISFRVGKGGSEDSELFVKAPEAVLTHVSDTSMSFKWEPVPGAKAYYINVLSMYVDPDWSTLEVALLDDYTFTNLGNVNEVTIGGLTPGMSYQVSVYACSDKNFSNASQGFFSTFSDDMKQVIPLLDVVPGDTYADLSWFDVPDADHYEATVATRTEEAPELGLTVAWDNRKYPSGWTFPGGTFDTRDDYVGASSPSLRMNTGTALTTDIFSNDIGAVSIWARTNIENGSLTFKVYAVEPGGGLSQIGEVNEVPATKEGIKLEFKDFPTGVKQLMFVYTARTAGLTMNIDDIEFYNTGKVNDTPVAGYDSYKVSGTTLKAEGLTPQTSYVAYMRAVKVDGTASSNSKAVKFTTVDPSGIESAEVNDASFRFADGVVSSTEAVNIYAADGTAIARNVIGNVQLPARGIYVITSQSNTTKVVW